jgi:hypothetical protein
VPTLPEQRFIILWQPLALYHINVAGLTTIISAKKKDLLSTTNLYFSVC